MGITSRLNQRPLPTQSGHRITIPRLKRPRRISPYLKAYRLTVCRPRRSYIRALN